MFAVARFRGLGLARNSRRQIGSRKDGGCRGTPSPPAKITQSVHGVGAHGDFALRPASSLAFCARRMRAGTAAVLAIAVASLVVATPSGAQTDGGIGALEIGASLDPLDLARAASRAGDAVVERTLSSDEAEPRQRRIALESAPFVHAPIRLVAPLARLASGRDPELAPAAMRVLVAIAERLVPNDLARDEVMPAELRAVIQSLRALRRDATAREDLRSAAGRVEGTLSSLLE